jgi:hypothetical protein
MLNAPYSLRAVIPLVSIHVKEVFPMSRLRCRILAFSLAFAGAFSLAAEDLTVISKTTFGGKSGTSTQWMSSTKSRTSDANTDAIIEFKTGRYVFVEHKKKEYWETTVEEMAAYFDALQKDLKGNPMFESMFGGPDDVKVEKLKTSRKIAGYDCDDYEMSMGPSFVFEFCAAKALKPPPQYYEGRKYSFASMGPMGKRYMKMFEEMRKIEGFPLSLEMDVDMGMTKQQTLSEATEVKKGPIDDSVFAVPAGYKKGKSPFKR